MTQPPQAPMPHYGPAPVPPMPYPPRPPRQPTTLWRPLIWTLCLSAVGAVVLVAALVALVLAIIVMFLLIVAAMVDSVTVDEIFEGDWIGGMLRATADWGPEFAVIVGVALMIGTASLLLLRLSTSVRTWSPFLQGLTAAGITYVIGSMALMLALQLI
ncbi:hypothetical protein [Nocardioides speluncae]|uniref:hypothetical protein n=1 Tax=Nocardioides speluncae TaxID=2670337 RepID=UPI000D68B1B0|nr:hypothetical protein [Nocardioides speluncae]